MCQIADLSSPLLIVMILHKIDISHPSNNITVIERQLSD